jgi:hypothetical protein
MPGFTRAPNSICLTSPSTTENPTPDTILLGPGVPLISLRAIASELGCNERDAEKFILRLSDVIRLKLPFKPSWQTTERKPIPIPVLEIREGVKYVNHIALIHALHLATNPLVPLDSLPNLEAWLQTIRRRTILDQLKTIGDMIVPHSSKRTTNCNSKLKVYPK